MDVIFEDVLEGLILDLFSQRNHSNLEVLVVFKSTASQMVDLGKAEPWEDTNHPFDGMSHRVSGSIVLVSLCFNPFLKMRSLDWFSSCGVCSSSVVVGSLKVHESMVLFVTVFGRPINSEVYTSISEMVPKEGSLLKDFYPYQLCFLVNSDGICGTCLRWAVVFYLCEKGRHLIRNMSDGKSQRIGFLIGVAIFVVFLDLLTGLESSSTVRDGISLFTCGRGCFALAQGKLFVPTNAVFQRSTVGMNVFVKIWNRKVGVSVRLVRDMVSCDEDVYDIMEAFDGYNLLVFVSDIPRVSLEARPCRKLGLFCFDFQDLRPTLVLLDGFKPCRCEIMMGRFYLSLMCPSEHHLAMGFSNLEADRVADGISNCGDGLHDGSDRVLEWAERWKTLSPYRFGGVGMDAYPVYDFHVHFMRHLLVMLVLGLFDMTLCVSGSLSDDRYLIYLGYAIVYANEKDGTPGLFQFVADAVEDSDYVPNGHFFKYKVYDWFMVVSWYGDGQFECRFLKDINHTSGPGAMVWVHMICPISYGERAFILSGAWKGRVEVTLLTMLYVVCQCRVVDIGNLRRGAVYCYNVKVVITPEGIFNQLEAGSPSKEKLADEVLFWRPTLMLRRGVSVAPYQVRKRFAVGMHLRHYMVYLLLLITMGFVRHVPSLNSRLFKAPE